MAGSGGNGDGLNTIAAISDDEAVLVVLEHVLPFNEALVLRSELLVENEVVVLVEYAKLGKAVGAVGEEFADNGLALAVVHGFFENFTVLVCVSCFAFFLSLRVVVGFPRQSAVFVVSVFGLGPDAPTMVEDFESLGTACAALEDILVYVGPFAGLVGVERGRQEGKKDEWNCEMYSHLVQI